MSALRTRQPRRRSSVRKLAAEGIELIEVCGAFGPEGAAAVAQAAGDKVAVGYVVHDPSQDQKFAALFG